MIKEVSVRCSPLCFLPSGRLVCYKSGDILIFEQDSLIKQFSLTTQFKEKYLSRCNYLNRLLRIGVRAAIAIDEQTILISFGTKIVECNLKLETISKGYECEKGVRPLTFCKVENVSSIDNGIYFGGYLLNMNKKPVSVYKRVEKDKWEIVYTYPTGKINHIHAIVPDNYRNCLWIFTGDFGYSSAIWKITKNFQNVECFCCNNQNYRGCVAFALPEGVLYATDAPFTKNHIYLMKSDSRIYTLKEIDGSCIYGCQWKDQYVFSTTVEGDGRNLSKMDFLFGRKRGAGIKDNYVHMYCGNIQNSFHEIYKEKKDFMPFYTFQFGVFKFPTGINTSNSLYFQPVATNCNDLKLMKIKEYR